MRVLYASSCAMTSALAASTEPESSVLSAAISSRRVFCASVRAALVFPSSVSSVACFSSSAAMYSRSPASVFSSSPMVFFIEATCSSIEGILVFSSSEILCSRELILSSNFPQEDVAMNAVTNANDGNSLLIFIVCFHESCFARDSSETVLRKKKVWSRSLSVRRFW